MSGVCLRPRLNNEPVSKRKRVNDYAAPESPESPEAPKEVPTMAGQGNTAKQIALSLRCEETAKQNMIKQKELERKAEKAEAQMSVTHDTVEKHIVRLKDLEAEVEKKTLHIVDLVDRMRSSRKQLDGVNSQNKALFQLKPDLRTDIAIAEEQDKTISKM